MGGGPRMCKTLVMLIGDIHISLSPNQISFFYNDCYGILGPLLYLFSFADFQNVNVKAWVLILVPDKYDKGN
jgi:hypothetical protein